MRIVGSPHSGVCAGTAIGFPHSTTLPVRAVHVIAVPCFTGQTSSTLMCASYESTAMRLSSSKSKEYVRQRLPVLMLHTSRNSRLLIMAFARSWRARSQKLLPRTSIVCWRASVCLQKTIVLETYQVMYHHVEQRQMSACVHSLRKNITRPSSLSHKFSRCEVVFGGTHLESSMSTGLTLRTSLTLSTR